MFISIEGIDFVGKTTQAKIFAKTLRWRYGENRVILTHEPGGTPFGMRVREILKSEPTISLRSQWHLVEAQRFHHLEEVLLPSYNDKKFIVCDRYIDSSYVYQNALFSEDEWIDYLSKHPLTPDLTFVLYTSDVEKLREKRIGGFDRFKADHFDNASVEDLERKQQLYLQLQYFSRVVPINCDGEQQEVANAILNKFDEKYSYSGEKV